jgi:hypothetical protein
MLEVEGVSTGIALPGQAPFALSMRARGKLSAAALSEGSRGA